MRKTAGVLAALVVLAGFALAVPKDEPQSRTLTGQVTDKSDKPLSGAVVYLQNSRTQTVKTFIAGQDGNYRFTALSPNVDYVVYAEYQGHKSDNKTLSSFDSRANVVIHLKINLAK
jgi:hypothetical protein